MRTSLESSQAFTILCARKCSGPVSPPFAINYQAGLLASAQGMITVGTDMRIKHLHLA